MYNCAILPTILKNAVSITEPFGHPSKSLERPVKRTSQMSLIKELGFRDKLQQSADADRVRGKFLCDDWRF